MFAVNWHMCDWMQGVTNKFELGFVDAAWHRKYMNNIITTLIFCKFADLYRPSCLLVVFVFCLTVCLLVLVWTLTFVSHCFWSVTFCFSLTLVSTFVVNKHIYIYIFTHNHAHTTILRPLSGTTQVSQCQKKSSCGLYGAREDDRGRHTDHLAGRHSIRTNQRPPPIIPHFLQAGCPSLRRTDNVKALTVNYHTDTAKLIMAAL